MKQATLSIKETFTYNREVVINLPDSMTENELNAMLDRAERGADNADDILYSLKRQGITHEPYDKDFDCPDDSEAECIDYDLPSGEQTPTCTHGKRMDEYCPECRIKKTEPWDYRQG